MLYESHFFSHFSEKTYFLQEWESQKAKVVNWNTYGAGEKIEARIQNQWAAKNVMRRNTTKEWKRQITCETRRDLKCLFCWREQEMSPRKPGSARSDVKVTNFLIFQLRTKCCNSPLWGNSAMRSTLAPHYALLDPQLFSVCLTLKGHAGNCQHIKGHAICNRGMWIEKLLSRGKLG